jgi:hypothetical protein
MVPALDRGWVDAMIAVCDPVYAAADVGFVRQISRDGDTVKAILWEAKPVEFARRYPDSGIVGSYGDQWPPPCIDYWVYLDAEAMEAQFSVEGWSGPDEVVPLSGDGEADGLAIASAMARILRVPPPAS